MQEDKIHPFLNEMLLENHQETRDYDKDPIIIKNIDETIQLG